MRKRRNSENGRERGFTLLEMMVVIAIVVILATIAAGQYQRSVIRAREVALHSDLHTMRIAIDDYTRDKECGPSSLDDLVTNNYIGGIPEDPMTDPKPFGMAQPIRRYALGSAVLGQAPASGSCPDVGAVGEPVRSPGYTAGA